MQIGQSKGIKEIIEDYPEVAKILQNYGIECATCSVGICQLKDVLEIHSLPEEQASSLMEQIESVLSGDALHSDSAVKSVSTLSSSATNALSEAILTLMREHTFIKRFIAVAPYLTQNLDLSKQSDQIFAGNCLEFITCYADKLHHGKEEDILFHYFDTSDDIFQAMFEEHTKGRTLVGLMRSNIADKDTDTFTKHFVEYHDLLKEHINKEDTILFPWLDRRMSDEQKQEMNSKFVLSDRENDVDSKQFEDFVYTIEEDMLGKLVADE